jgi:hypothetical protein
MELPCQDPGIVLLAVLGVSTSLNWCIDKALNPWRYTDEMKFLQKACKTHVSFRSILQDVPRKTGPTHSLSTNLHIWERRPFPTFL